MVNTRAHPANTAVIRPAEIVAASPLVVENSRPAAEVARRVSVAPRNGSELKEMFKGWEISAKLSAQITSYNEPLLVAIIRNQNSLYSLLSETPALSHVPWCGAPSNGREVKSYSVDWTLSSSDATDWVPLYDEPLMVAIMRNQETLLGAINYNTTSSYPAPAITKAPSSGAELRIMFKDWKVSAPGQSSLVSCYDEPLLVEILRNQSVLVNAASASASASFSASTSPSANASAKGTTSATQVTKAPVTGPGLRDMFKGWELSAPASSALSSRYDEPLICAIMRNQETLRQALLAAKRISAGTKFIFHDLGRQPPMQLDCCAIL